MEEEEEGVLKLPMRLHIFKEIWSLVRSKAPEIKVDRGVFSLCLALDGNVVYHSFYWG